MSSRLNSTERCDAEQRRRSPGEISHLVATFTAGDKIPPPAYAPDGPIQIMLEATDDGGTLAPWVHDDWFTRLLQRFGDAFVTLRVAPTPGALLHPCVLYEAEMVRRVVPHWRVVATAYIDDVCSDDDIGTIAHGPYHEIRFFDHTRDNPPALEVGDAPRPLATLFARLRQAQEESSGRSPILVRLPSGTGRPHPTHPTRLVERASSRSADAAVTS